VLPNQKHGKGAFDGDGYQFWKPQDLGGWAMAHSDTLAVALVFGKREYAENEHGTRVVFNKLDWPQHRLNVLLPAIETDWPDDSILTQELIIVVGAPEDVAARADRLADLVGVPSVTEHEGDGAGR
jgi:hypothetical protein